MILELIMYAISVIVNMFGQFLPGNGDVPLLLPWGIDSIFNQGVTGYKILSTSFPPFAVVLDAFLIYLGFKIIIRLLKAVPVLGKTLG